MSLLDDLKHAAQLIDPQFQVTSNEVQGVLAAVVHYLEHGDKLLQAAEHGVDDVQGLIAPAPPEPQPEPASAPAPPADGSAAAPAPDTLTNEEIDRQLSDLEALKATRQATSTQTTVEHEPGVSTPTSPVSPTDPPSAV